MLPTRLTSQTLPKPRYSTPWRGFPWGSRAPLITIGGLMDAQRLHGGARGVDGRERRRNARALCITRLEAVRSSAEDEADTPPADVNRREGSARSKGGGHAAIQCPARRIERLAGGSLVSASRSIITA
jgi:hypothetical protein